MAQDNGEERGMGLFAKLHISPTGRLGKALGSIRLEREKAQDRVTEYDELIDMIEEIFETVDNLLESLEVGVDSVTATATEFKAAVQVQRDSFRDLIEKK